MNRAWGTSETHSRFSVSIFKVNVIQGHEIKERPNQNFLAWVMPCYTIFRPVFRKKAKKWSQIDTSWLLAKLSMTSENPLGPYRLRPAPVNPVRPYSSVDPFGSTGSLDRAAHRLSSAASIERGWIPGNSPI